MLRGIILSEEDKNIEIEILKQLDIKFIFLRAAYTSYGINKEKYEDSKFKEFYKKLLENGYKVFTYYESCATNIDEVKNEANYFLQIINFNNISEPIVVFINDDHNTVIYSKLSQKSLSKNELSNIISEFCKIINQNGHDIFVLTEFANEYTEYDIKFNVVIDDSNIYRLIKFEDNVKEDIQIVIKNDCLFYKIKSDIKIIVKKISKIIKNILQILK